MKRAWWALALAAAVGCNLVLDIRDGTLRPTGSSGSTGSAGSTGSGGACEGPVEPNGSLQWARNSTSEAATGTAVAAGPGTVVLGGFFYDQFSLAGTNATADEFFDMFVASFDTTTQQASWARVFQGAGESRIIDVAVDGKNGAIYAVGQFDGTVTIEDGVPWTAPDMGPDGFIFRLDPADGDVVWALQWSGVNYQDVDRIVVDGDGNLIVAGFGYGQLEFGQPMPLGGPDESVLFLIKLDADGNILWSRDYDASNIEACPNIGWYGCAPLALAVDAVNDIYFAGGTYMQLETTPPYGGSDVFLIKLDAAGTLLWDRLFSGPGMTDQWATALAVDACSGDIYLGGAFFDELMMDDAAPLAAVDTVGPDAFVARLDPNGTAVWSRAFGDIGYQVINSLVTDGTGDVVLGALLVDAVGSTAVSFGGEPHMAPPPDGGDYHEDFAVARLGRDATYRWSHRYGDLYIQTGEIAIGPPGIVAGGEFFEQIQFDGTVNGKLNNADSRDLYVAVFNP